VLRSTAHAPIPVRERHVFRVARIRQHQHHRAVGIFCRRVIHARRRSAIRGLSHLMMMLAGRSGW
jgi:hypothetical protein